MEKELETAFIKLKCFLCEKYLSVGPIYTSEDGSKFKCGRCKDIGSWQSNIMCPLFEKFVSCSSNIPCSFKGCDQLLKWADVAEHEKNCEHRLIFCPMSLKCQELVNIPFLAQHIELCHSKDLYYNEWVRGVTTKTQTAFCLKENDQLIVGFLISRRPYTYFSVFFVTLPNNNNNNKIKYTLKISCKGSDTSISFSNKNIAVYNDQIHCYCCMRERCKIKFHENSGCLNILNDNDVFIKVDFNDVQKILGRNPSLTFKLITHDSTEHTETGVEISKNETLLRINLECPVCYELMSPPIYCCNRGHAICNKCKVQIVQCPFCKDNIIQNRIYALEELSLNIELLCSFFNKGCNEKGTIEFLQKHEGECIFKDN